MHIERVWQRSGHPPAVSVPGGCGTLRRQCISDSEGSKLAGACAGLVFH